MKKETIFTQPEQDNRQQAQTTITQTKTNEINDLFRCYMSLFANLLNKFLCLRVLDGGIFKNFQSDSSIQR